MTSSANNQFKDYIYNKLGAKCIYSSFTHYLPFSIYKLDRNKLELEYGQSINNNDYFLKLQVSHNFKFAGYELDSVLYNELCYIWFKEDIKLKELDRITNKENNFNIKIGLNIPKCSMHYELQKSKSLDINKIVIEKEDLNHVDDIIYGTIAVKYGELKKEILDISFSNIKALLIFEKWKRTKFTQMGDSKAFNLLIQKEIYLILMAVFSNKAVISENTIKLFDKIEYNFNEKTWKVSGVNYPSMYPNILLKFFEIARTGKIEWNQLQ
jgi:hypothetical protein